MHQSFTFQGVGPGIAVVKCVTFTFGPRECWDLDLNNSHERSVTVAIRPKNVCVFQISALKNRYGRSD